jgi:hypothetical protein
MSITSTALDRRAFVGRPQGYPTKSFPNGDLILRPSKWNRFHWSFDEELRTRGKAYHKPISTTEALDLVTKMLADLGKVGK